MTAAGDGPPGLTVLAACAPSGLDGFWGTAKAFARSATASFTIPWVSGVPVLESA